MTTKASTKGETDERPRPLFHPGRTYVTRGVGQLLEEEKLEPGEVRAFLDRHLSGDWGCLESFDRRQNEDALRSGARLFSAYRSLRGDRLWVITEATDDAGRRASTTVLLPEEY